MKCEKELRADSRRPLNLMDYGVACFQSGAIVWASKRDLVVQKVDELAKFGFEPHQPIFQTGMYWYARLAAPRGKDARAMRVSSL